MRRRFPVRSSPLQSLSRGTTSLKTYARKHGSWASAKSALPATTADTRTPARRSGPNTPMRSALRWNRTTHRHSPFPAWKPSSPHFGTYEIAGALALKLADHIRSLGYHAQIHSPNDNTGIYIPLFVSAGLGQLGRERAATLSPLPGPGRGLMLITTDAPVHHDEPIDYGINKYCEECQVCVVRCPARALLREKVWYRGVQKNKLVYDRCRPIMITYEGCAVCMKVCPVQRYGMKPVMEHYVATGDILGKGTPNLEGYELRGKGYFGPGDLPHFDREAFEFPHGTKEEWLFKQFKEKLEKNGGPAEEEAVEFANELKTDGRNRHLAHRRIVSAGGSQGATTIAIVPPPPPQYDV